MIPDDTHQSSPDSSHTPSSTTVGRSEPDTFDIDGDYSKPGQHYPPSFYAPSQLNYKELFYPIPSQEARIKSEHEKSLETLGGHIIDLQMENEALKKKLEKLEQEEKERERRIYNHHQNPQRVEVLRREITDSFKQLAQERCEVLVDSLELLHELESKEARLSGAEGIAKERGRISQLSKAFKRPFKKVRALRRDVARDREWLEEGGLSKPGGEENLEDLLDHYRRATKSLTVGGLLNIDTG